MGTLREFTEMVPGPPVWDLHGTQAVGVIRKDFLAETHTQTESLLVQFNIYSL